MLPPNLAELKAVLTSKGFAKRSSGEDRILEELDLLDQSPEVRKILNEALANEKIRASSVFSGPSGSCPCCGKAV